MRERNRIPAPKTDKGWEKREIGSTDGGKVTLVKGNVHSTTETQI